MGFEKELACKVQSKCENMGLSPSAAFYENLYRYFFFLYVALYRLLHNIKSYVPDL